MLLKNAVICFDDFTLRKSDIRIENELIAEIGDIPGEGEDLGAKVILPGFIDIHIHGCNGADCSDESPASVLKMSEYLAGRGVTSFCPTTMTLPEDRLRTAFSNIGEAAGNEPGAYIHGINMEGPFISEEKKGAHEAEFIKEPDIEMFKRLNSICKVRIVDIAPEKDKDFRFVKEINKINYIYKDSEDKTVISAAHTAADYTLAKSAFESGYSHVTHLFNAMTQFGSREPGMVGAVFDSGNVTAELICDGIHVAPAALRSAFRLLGKDRAVVISDATMGAGLPDGEYTLAGQIIIKTDAVRLPGGTLAGSATNLFDEFRNLLSYGIPFEHALRSVTMNPARVLGANNETGSLTKGKSADFIIVNEGYSDIFATFVKGKRVFDGKSANRN